jgi:tetratricopeptide (TPR) repeat protein
LFQKSKTGGKKMKRKGLVIGFGMVLGMGLMAGILQAEWWEVWKKPEKVQAKAQKKKPEAKNASKKNTAKSIKRSDDPAQQLLNEGDALYAESITLGTITKAVAKYQELVDTYPDSPLVYGALMRISRCYTDMGKFLDILKEKEWYKKAIEIDKKIIEKYPIGTQSLESYYVIGITYLDLEEYSNAETWLNKAIEKYTEYNEPTLKVELALVNCYEGQGRHQEALDKINQLIADHPDHPGVKYYHWQYISGVSYVGLGRYDEAIEIFKNTLIKGDPRIFYPLFREEITFYIGELYEWKGDYVNARLWYQKVIDDYPDGGLADDAEEKLGELEDKINKRGKK